MTVQKNLVLRSIETPDGGRCVDIFRRADGSYGFEAYRRDAEDAKGWFPLGYFADQTYACEKDALRAALMQVQWLRELGAEAGQG